MPCVSGVNQFLAVLYFHFIMFKYILNGCWVRGRRVAEGVLMVLKHPQVFRTVFLTWKWKFSWTWHTKNCPKIAQNRLQARSWGGANGAAAPPKFSEQFFFDMKMEILTDLTDLTNRHGGLVELHVATSYYRAPSTSYFRIYISPIKTHQIFYTRRIKFYLVNTSKSLKIA